MSRWLLVLLMLSGCSFDSGDAPNENGSKWVLDSGETDATLDSQISANNATNNATNNVTNPTNNVTNPTNNTTNNGTNPADAGPDLMPPVEDAGMDVASQPDLPVGPCQTNSDCPAQGDVCCPQIAGDSQCKPQDQCLVHGTCDDAADCLGNEECCPLPAISGTGGICAAQCIGNGGSQTPCATNSECSNGLVCCSGLSGNTCSNRCWSGGVCAVDADCTGGTTCCDVRFGDKQCFNRCF